MIKKLFIANRGEVCRRIALTAKRMGIETATVLVETQPPAYLLGVVDQFIKPQDGITNPYLSIEEMIRLARETGCEAIHPGFGFLSENADFAKRCGEAGLLWVGPHAQAIEAMASKSNARQIALAAGLPVTPALSGINFTDEKSDLKRAQDFLRQNGAPVIVKAAYGGGGKGMRLVYEEAHLEEALRRCHSEAKSSFGNGELLVEKYIEKPRHVEVQIFGDKRKNVIAFGDRDCSAQRRHQKIIEEAPAPQVHAETRRKMHAAAIDLGKRVGYDSAGTVEFLLDASTDWREEQKFYFLEMNTRLQVEHPVTEEVFGIDLVEWQLRVASGEKLSPEFAELPPRGHSIEVRIYAEDCENNFMPSPGMVDVFIPYYQAGIRWEIGLDRSGMISTMFDPMVAKCVARGATRQEAMDRLTSTLRNTVFFGPSHNIEFLVALLECAAFKSGVVSTHYIKDHIDQLLQSIQDQRRVSEDLVGKALQTAIESLEGGQSADLSASMDVVVMTAFSPRKLSAPNLRDVVNYPHGQNAAVRVVSGLLVLDAGRVAPVAMIDRGEDVSFWINWHGQNTSKVLSRGQSLESAAGGSTGAVSSEVVAPVPGRIVAVKVDANAAVEKNTVLLVLESMKMEFEIRAPIKGVVKSILVKTGDQVDAGRKLVTWHD